MAVLGPRFHSFSTIHQQSASGWSFCMSKAYCKWPTIVGIIIAVLVFCLTLFCCIRCCTRRSRGRNRANTASMFNPAPYKGYEPANNPNSVLPPHGEPAQYAQFDAPSGKKITEDSLPPMPSWDAAQSKRVEQEGEDMEMGRLDKPSMEQRPMKSFGANASSVNLLRPEMDSHPVTQIGQLSPHYTGPDFGHGAGHAYTGPDFGPGHGQQTAYSAYAPSESTKYEPSGVNEPQELGTQYSTTVLPPSSPGAHMPGFGEDHHAAPSVLQAGRRPAGNGGGMWRDV